MHALHQHDKPFVLGLTGGVATGKTVVAEMFETFGAKTIDFDTLSRIVVEPGKPAWNEIVAFFGQRVLRPDTTLDRKKLAEIVFRDTQKRKTLESFVHPRVAEEFTRAATEYAGESPDTVIQAVVPLLFETNMQSVFDRVVVVYAPEEVQIERVVERDGINRDAAADMISSQWPIEDKKSRGDFVIDNSGSLGETRKQVEIVWTELKRIQK